MFNIGYRDWYSVNTENNGESFELYNSLGVYREHSDGYIYDKCKLYFDTEIRNNEKYIVRRSGIIMREQTKQRMIRNIKEELAIDTMSKTDLEIIAEELEITTIEFVDIFEEVMEEVKIDTVKKLKGLV